MLRLLEAGGTEPQTLPCAGQRAPPGTHRPWCPMPSFQQEQVFSTSPVSSKGWVDPAAAAAQGWGMFSSGERAGAGWSSRLPEQARGNGDCKGSLSRIRGRPACHAWNLLPSSLCLLLLPLVFSSSFPLKPECGFPSCFAPALSQHIPAPASVALLSQSLPFSAACSPLSLPSHSQLPGWFPRLSIPLFSQAPPYALCSLWRLCPSMRLRLWSISITGRQQPAAECPTGLHTLQLK